MKNPAGANALLAPNYFTVTTKQNSEILAGEYTTNNYRRPSLLIIGFLVMSIMFSSNVMGQTGTVSGVPTFHCIGLYWSGSGGGSGTVCYVQYRVLGSGASYKNGYPLVFDSRSIHGRPANEYRGSLVNLAPNTTYEIVLTAGAATNTLNVTTWSEIFPVASVTNITTSQNLTTSGTASGYLVYTGSITGGGNNLYIDASYIIIRNMTLTDADQDAIVLGPDAHHVVIEGCDISGWGYIGMGSNNQAAVRIKGGSYDATSVKQIIVQRNKIHDSRENGSSWDENTHNGNDHPLGPNGITFDESGGNHVIRYNEIYTTTSNKFMDGIGGGENFSYTGSPGSNSDIYSNTITNVYDDAIEAEGGGMNVRVWGNWMSNTFTGVATATVSIGPMYVFRNISNLSMRSPSGTSISLIDDEDRGPFNKCGSQDPDFRGGRTYLFHNTVLQPTESGYTYSRGMGGGPVDNGGPVTNVISRNNIWQTCYTTYGGWPIAFQNSSPTGQDCDLDYDLMNYNPTGHIGSATLGSNKIIGTPSYTVSMSTSGTPNSAGYFLQSSTDGVDDGQVLNNFSDGYTGDAPDIGAYETGNAKLEFGTNAYLGIVAVKAFLRGAYSSGAGAHKAVTTTWRDVLRNNATSQPYNTTAFGNYNGGETVTTSVFNATASATDIVDWVLIELRDATAPATVIARRAALIRVDGQVVDLDGSSNLSFNSLPAGNYHLSIRHRNHLGIRTASALAIGGGSVTTYDFTTSQSQAYQDGSITSNDAMDINGSTYLMWGGNVNPTVNTTVSFTGLNNDAVALLAILGGNQGAVITSTYNVGDINMNGTVSFSGLNNDQVFLISMLGGNQGAIRRQHF